MDTHIRVVTDCDGTKFNAIKHEFSKHFKRITMHSVEPVNIQTPTKPSDLFHSIEARLSYLRKKDNVQNERTYFCTIQRGYFFDGNFWFLHAAIAVLSPKGIQARSFTSSIQIEHSVSEAKIQYKDKTMSSLLSKKFPHWKKETSVYTLHTNEGEEVWFQKPLEHCLKYLSM